MSTNGADHEPEPPYSLQHEQATLGALLIDGSAWDKVAYIVRGADFYRSDHRVIFNAISALAGAGKAIDVLTVSDELERHHMLIQVGGLAYLGTLARETPTAANVRAYAEEVHERAELRGFLELQGQVARAISDGNTSQQIAETLAFTAIESLRARGKRPKAIHWAGWQGRTPPAREWWQQDWLGPEPHLLAGAGGIGKSLFLQTTATAMALGRELLGVPARPLRVLLWLCEDQEPEIMRRQDAICAHFGIEREDVDLDDRLIIEPRVGFDNTLFELHQYGKPVFTPEFHLLHQQVNDLKIDLLGLDNIGQVYGANENDRHQVTKFVNGLRGIVHGRPFCPLLVGHVARTQGSEFSGNAAWENAARMRWYMGTHLPDQKHDLDDEEPAQSDVVYLAKRKANYSEKDYRKLHYQNGLLVPEQYQGPTGPIAQGYRNDLADRIVLKAMSRLIEAGVNPTDGPSSPDYLPKQILAKGYAEGHSKKEITSAMHRLMGAGRLKRGQIGEYSNRNPRFGLLVGSP